MTCRRGFRKTTAPVFSLLVIVVAALSGCERFALDRQMEKFCKKDGGVKVYETVTLPPAEFETVINYVAKAKSRDDYYGPDYRFVEKREILVGEKVKPERGQGRLTRWYEAIYRRSDKRLLGESILYARAGGDGFTFGFQPSSNFCPRPRVGLGTSVFLKGERQ